MQPTFYELSEDDRKISAANALEASSRLSQGVQLTDLPYDLLLGYVVMRELDLGCAIAELQRRCEGIQDTADACVTVYLQ